MTQTYLKDPRRDRNGLIDYQHYHQVGKLERNREMRRLYNLITSLVRSGLSPVTGRLTQAVREVVSTALAGK